MAKVDGPLSSAKLDTVLVYVRDLKAMLAFYRDKLGMEVTFANERFASLRSKGGASLALHSGRGRGKNVKSHWLLEFAISDMDAVVAALRASGVDVSTPKKQSWGRTATFMDPEGNVIGLESSR